MTRLLETATRPVAEARAPAGAAPIRILCKVGEASLKGRNKRMFTDALRRNLKAALAGVDARVEGGGSVLVVAIPDDATAEEAAARVERVFGFVTASLTRACERDPAVIAALGARNARAVRARDFAVRVRRRDKSFPLTSQQLERAIGAEVQALTGLPVRLRDPDLEVRVELDREWAYVRTRELRCAGGLPVGVSGRALVLLSGGIDSPVAALLAMKRGLSVEFVHFSGEPYLDAMAAMKAQAQAKVLNGFQATRPGTLWVVPFGTQQRTLSAVSEESHRIVLYRRQMARIACALANSLGAAALVTGDSLGQVSSQTLPNMTSTEEAAELPVLRPLLTWDKREVMAKAAELGILALSELPAEDACPLFAGGKQRTAVPRAALLEAEAMLDLPALAAQAAAEARRVEIGALLGALEREPRAPRPPSAPELT
jgi:thiamine biosynthesis protein ThiI